MPGRQPRRNPPGGAARRFREGVAGRPLQHRSGGRHPPPPRHRLVFGRPCRHPQQPGSHQPGAAPLCRRDRGRVLRSLPQPALAALQRGGPGRLRASGVRRSERQPVALAGAVDRRVAPHDRRELAGRLHPSGPGGRRSRPDDPPPVPRRRVPERGHRNRGQLRGPRGRLSRLFPRPRRLLRRLDRRPADPRPCRRELPLSEQAVESRRRLCMRRDDRIPIEGQRT